MNIEKRLDNLERAVNVHTPVYVIESRRGDRAEFFNVFTKEITLILPEGARILARVGIDIKRIGER